MLDEDMPLKQFIPRQPY